MRQEAPRRQIPIAPQDVHATIGRHMLADGEHLVVDLQGSHGAYLRDATTGREYLDFYAYFASQPVAHNHPGLSDPRVPAPHRRRGAL